MLEEKPHDHEDDQPSPPPVEKSRSGEDWDPVFHRPRSLDESLHPEHHLLK